MGLVGRYDVGTIPDPEELWKPCEICFHLIGYWCYVPCNVAECIYQSANEYVGWLHTFGDMEKATDYRLELLFCYGISPDCGIYLVYDGPELLLQDS